MLHNLRLERPTNLEAVLFPFQLEIQVIGSSCPDGNASCPNGNAASSTSIPRLGSSNTGASCSYRIVAGATKFWGWDIECHSLCDVTSYIGVLHFIIGASVVTTDGVKVLHYQNSDRSIPFYQICRFPHFFSDIDNRVVGPGSPDPGTSFGTYVLVDVW